MRLLAKRHIRNLGLGRTKMNSNITANVGVLLGWKHQNFDGKLVVQLQTLSPGKDTKHDAYDTLDVMMTPSQALVLAQYLTKIADGRTPPIKRSVWKRLLGKN